MKRCVNLMALAGLLMVAVPQSALAEGKPIYSYVEAGYNEVDVDDLGGTGDDGSGGFAGVSVGFFKNFHAFGRYVSNNTDDFDVDLTTTIIGVGWHGLLGEKADLIGEVAWIDQEVDLGSSSGKFDDNGYLGRVGARWRPIKLVEVGGWVRFQELDLGNIDVDEAYEANAMVHLWRIGLGLAAEIQGDVETYSAFARFNFGG